MARAVIRSKATLDGKDFETKIGRMKKSVQSFAVGELRQLGSSIAAAFATRAVIQFGQRQLEAADRTADLASILNVSAEALQTLNVAALQYGGTTQMVEKSLLELKRAQGEALNGSTAMAKAFQGLYISEKELATLDTQTLIERVAIGYVKAGSGAEALAHAQLVLGRSGKELAGVLQHIGETGLQASINLEKLKGRIFDDETIAQLAKANNQLELMGKTISTRVTIAVVGMLNKFGDVARFLDNNPTLKAIMLIGNPIAQPLYAIGRLINPTRVDPTKPFPNNDSNSNSGSLQQLAKHLAKIQQARSGAIENITVAMPQPADSLAAIGGAIGGQSNSLFLGQMDRLLQTAEITEKTIDEIAQLTKDNGITLTEILSSVEE